MFSHVRELYFYQLLRLIYMVLFMIYINIRRGATQEKSLLDIKIIDL